MRYRSRKQVQFQDNDNVSNRPTKLYHFTCRAWWRFIQREGINEGQVVVNRGGMVLNYPCLTTDPDPKHQCWAPIVGEELPDVEVFGPSGKKFRMGVNKRAVRVTVDISKDDPRLVSWLDLTRQHRMDRDMFRRLARTEGYRGSEAWWIFKGHILPEQFVAVDYFDDGRIHPSELGLIEQMKTASTYREAKAFLITASILRLP